MYTQARFEQFNFMYMYIYINVSDDENSFLQNVFVYMFKSNHNYLDV